MLSSTGKSTPKKSKTPEVGVDTSDILKEQEALASTPPEELEASAPVAVPPLVDKVVEEPHEEPLEEPQAKLQDSLPETEKNAPEELEPASLEATPSTNPSVAIVDKALLPSPCVPHRRRRKSSLVQTLGEEPAIDSRCHIRSDLQRITHLSGLGCEFWYRQDVN